MEKPSTDRRRLAVAGACTMGLLVDIGLQPVIPQPWPSISGAVMMLAMGLFLDYLISLTENI
jgi:hypothetical protein